MMIRQMVICTIDHTDGDLHNDQTDNDLHNDQTYFEIKVRIKLSNM